MNDKISDREEKRTILGTLRENPFTVEKMAEAHRKVYGSTIQKMETTHLYVKFQPKNGDEVIALEKTGEFFYDFPLEYEIIELGDFYQEVTGKELPELYAVVKNDFVFPNVPYTIINELHLDKSDILVVAESYRITENFTDMKNLISGFKSSADNIPYALMGCAPPKPECEPGYVPFLVVDDTVEPVTCTWICDLPIDYPEPEPNLNSCGCTVFSDKHRPAGCVTVQDTELSTPNEPDTYEPVRQVKIIIKDNWFIEDETWTDNRGCWQVNEHYDGNAWMWVRFINDRCQIRGTANNFTAAWQWFTVIKDYVGKLSGSFNDIEVHYHMWSEQGSQAHRYWGAATVNNAVHEFHDFANQDGINPPLNGLDIYIGRNRTSGFALMARQSNLITGGSMPYTGSNPFVEPFAELINLAGLGLAVIQELLPDVFIGIDFSNSDRQKRLAYHELAHASHYSQVGPIFWGGLISAEVAALGHGNQNSDNADLIALCESWAGHIGHSYTHRRYGGDNSINFDWQVIEERTWNEYTNHIPVGLYNDLIDITEATFTASGTTVSACNAYESGCTMITDEVSGFTNDQMFSCLSSSTDNIVEFKNCLIANHLGSTANSVAQVNALFNSY